MKIKNGKLYVYDVENEYRDYLRQFDKRVSKKENRRFYGIIITKDNIDYCIPFTSQVKKRNSKLTINIKHKNKIIAQLLINNMIPVKDSVVTKVDIKKDKQKEYLTDEIMYLKNKEIIQEILNKTENVFNVIEDTENKDNEFFRKICCDYKLLNKKASEYKKTNT